MEALFLYLDHFVGSLFAQYYKGQAKTVVVGISQYGEMFLAVWVPLGQSMTLNIFIAELLEAEISLYSKITTL